MGSPKRFCIYCFEEDVTKLSREHIFPKCIGGKIWFDYCCRRCNSILGNSVDKRAKESLFLVTGINILGIQNASRAYDSVQIIDANTGAELQYKDTGIEVRQYKGKDGSIVGDKAFVRERLLADVERDFPHWYEFVKSRLSEGASDIRLPGKTIKLSNASINKITVKGQNYIPGPLLAKIAYEALFCFGMFTRQSCADFYESVFNVVRDDTGATAIAVRQSFTKRLGLLRHTGFNPNHDPTGFEYKSYHEISFHLTTSGIAYIRICLYGVCPIVVLVEKTSASRLLRREQLGVRYIFWTDRHAMDQVGEPWCDEELSQIEEDFVETLWNRSFEKAG